MPRPHDSHRRDEPPRQTTSSNGLGGQRGQHVLNGRGHVLHKFFCGLGQMEGVGTRLYGHRSVKDLATVATARRQGHSELATAELA